MKNTVLCYIEKDGQYLMLHRTKKANDANKDKWIGIGGKMEERESPEDCLKREVLEETGLSLSSYRYCGIITFVSDEWETEYMHLFHSDSFEGELTECSEGELCFIDKNQIFSLPVWEGDRIFIRLMQENRPFFSLKLCYTGERLDCAVLDGRKI